MVEVYDDMLSGRPKYDTAKADQGEFILELARELAAKDGEGPTGEPMTGAENCAMVFAFFGLDAFKAMNIESMRKDKADGKWPRRFEEEGQ